MMEVNLPKYNQRRISVVKFLAELYNYRIVDSILIIQVIWFARFLKYDPIFHPINQI